MSGSRADKSEVERLIDSSSRVRDAIRKSSRVRDMERRVAVKTAEPPQQGPLRHPLQEHPFYSTGRRRLLRLELDRRGTQELPAHRCQTIRRMGFRLDRRGRANRALSCGNPGNRRGVK